MKTTQPFSAVMGFLLGASLTAALPIRSLAAQTPPTRSAATAPATTPGAPTVRKLSFEDIYRLEDGEVAKFIPAPFIPERAGHVKGVGSADLARRGQLVFYWTRDAILKQWSFSAGDGNLASALAAGGLSSWEMSEASRDEKLRERFNPLPGDWIVREDATREQKLDAIQKILRHRLPDVLIEKSQVDRELAIAKGPFDAAAHPNLYIAVGERRGQNGGGSGTMSTFLLHLGNLTHHRFVDQTGSGDQIVQWQWDMSLSDDTYRFSDLLRDLEKETNLTFRTEREKVFVYFISKVEPK